MVLEGKLAVGALHLVLSGALGHAENVIVALPAQPLTITGPVSTILYDQYYRYDQYYLAIVGWHL